MLRNENDSLREDNRKVKHELFAAQDRYIYDDDDDDDAIIE